jgi:hypothetical protein
MTITSETLTSYQILGQLHPWTWLHLQKRVQQHHHQLSESGKEERTNYVFIKVHYQLIIKDHQLTTTGATINKWW